MKIIYRPEDEALLEAAKKAYENYQRDFYERLSSQTPPLDHQFARSSFLADPTRQSLCDVLIKINRALVPERIIYDLPPAPAVDSSVRSS